MKHHTHLDAFERMLLKMVESEENKKKKAESWENSILHTDKNRVDKPEPEPLDSEVEWHAIPKGGLRALAHTHLGDAERWPEIVEHNPDVLPHKDHHPEGTQVRIPKRLKKG